MSKKRVRDGVKIAALNVFFVLLCAITMVPIMYALSVSLNGQSGLLSSNFSFIPKEFTLNNYKEVLFGKEISVWVKNTVVLAMVTIFLSLSIAIPAAYCFSRRRFPGRKAILKALVLLNSFPAIKHLVKDGRYQYIETGSLISIKKNVKDILIPS